MPFRSVNLDLEKILSSASKRLGIPVPVEMIKGVKGLTNKSKFPESIEKGLLRAKWKVSIFKDGTLRFDATNAVLTHFRPGEVGLSLEKARSLGYEKDASWIDRWRQSHAQGSGPNDEGATATPAAEPAEAGDPQRQHV